MKPVVLSFFEYTGTMLKPWAEDRWKERSRTYQGIADACAEQWSKHIINTLTLEQVA